MTPDTYTVLAVITLSVLLGFALGCWVMTKGLDWMIRKGTLDIYVKGYKLERWRMW